MSKETDIRVEKFLRDLVLKLSSKLDREAVQAVNHYIDHDEYEMAFEGLFIEIMKFKEVLDINKKETGEIAYLLKLNEESVFESDFWSRFQKFIG